MPNYTPIALLPYPAMSDPPNGPEQILALASAVEAKLINRYVDSAARNLAVPAPSLGMMTFRDDGRVFEFWNGTAWEGVDRTIALSTRVSIASTTATAWGTVSGQLIKLSATITNPSASYRMHYFTSAEFRVEYTVSASTVKSIIRHYVTRGTAVTESRMWWQYGGNPSLGFTGTFPMRSGTLAPSEAITVSSYITIEKSGTGTAGMTLMSQELLIWGVTTV